jgi:hypothetical protein
MSDMATCPICGAPTESTRDRDYGDKHQYRCPRCGPFEISGTATAMLHGRFEQDPKAKARLSHAVRIATSEADWLFISSSNLDELLRQRLPGVEKQVERLCRWAAAQLAEDVLGQVALPKLEYLAGLVGVLNGERVQRLLDYAVAEGLINIDANYYQLALTPKAWKQLDEGSSPKAAQPIAPTISEATIAVARCNTCHGDRNAFVRATHTAVGGDGEIAWSDTYQVLECCGCRGLSIRRQYWLSEWDSVEGDPLTGQARPVPGIETTYWPPPTTRAKPAWVDGLQDDALRGTANEVYQALNAGLVTLATIGLRTLLDRAMYLRVGDSGGFPSKLSRMVSEGYVGHGEKETLLVMTDAGNAAAHRGYAPDRRTLLTIIEVIENFLHGEFVLKVAAASVKTATPPRVSETKGRS